MEDKALKSKGYHCPDLYDLRKTIIKQIPIKPFGEIDLGGGETIRDKYPLFYQDVLNPKPVKELDKADWRSITYLKAVEEAKMILHDSLAGCFVEALHKKLLDAEKLTAEETRALMRITDNSEVVRTETARNPEAGNSSWKQAIVKACKQADNKEQVVNGQS